MAGPKARIKKGNIVLFIVLIGIGAYIFNKGKIDQKLIEIGLLEKEAVVEKKETKTNNTKVDEKTVDFEAENEAIIKAEKKIETKEEKANKAHIATEAAFFFLNEDNPIQVSVDGIGGEAISVLMGRYKNIQIETIDKNSGKYNVKALRKGKAELSVMAKIDKKIDLIKTQEFEIVSRAEYVKKIEQRNITPQNFFAALPAINGRSGGAIGATVLKQASRLDLLFDHQNMTKNAVPSLLSYEVVRYSLMSSSTDKAKNLGANFSAATRRLVSQATANDLFYFTKIAIKTPDGKTVELPSIAFDVK